MKLVDVIALGAVAIWRVGSSPTILNISKRQAPPPPGGGGTKS